MSLWRGVRFGAFQLGVIAGVLAPIAGWVAIHFALGAAAPEMRPSRFDVLVEANGADVSAHGGKTLVVSHEHGAWSQTCRDGCDDLRVEASGGNDVFRVRVLDAAGACVACDDGRYVNRSYGQPATRWEVSGAGSLRVRVSDR